MTVVQRHRRMKATTRQFVLMLAALALMLPLTGWLVVQIQSPRVEREAYDNLAAIARLKTVQIENWLDERQKNGQVLSADVDFSQHVARLLGPSASHGSDREIVERRFTQLRQAYDYDSIELLDLRGHGLTSNSDAAVPLFVGDMVHRMRENGQAVQLDLNVNAKGHAQLRWLLPVFDANGPPRRLIAVVLMSIAPERFLFPAIQTWPTSSPSGETLLVNREGDAAVFMNELRHRRGTAMKLRFPMSDTALLATTALKSNQPGVGLGVDYRGIAVLAAYRPVAGTTWRVVAKIDQEEVLAPVRVLALWLSTVTLLAVMALGLVLVLFWRQLRRAQRLEVLGANARSDQLMERFFSLPFIGIAMGDLARANWSRFNAHFCTIVGCLPQDLGTLGWSDLVDPADFHEDVDGYEQLMRGEIDAYAVDRRIRRKDGTDAYVSMQLRSFADATEEAPRCIVMLQDITQRHVAELMVRRKSQLYAALSGCNQAILHCTSPDQLFASVCQTVVALGGMKMASIGLLDPQTKRVLPVASSGSDAFDIQGADDLAGAEKLFGGASVEAAVVQDRPVWIQDFPNTPGTATWHATATIPLHRNGRVMGVFMLVASEVNAFDEDAQHLLTEIASDVDYALENFERETQRQRAEQLLHRSQTQLELALKGSSDAPWDWDLVTQRLDYSPQGWHMLGYGLDDPPGGAAVWKALIHPQDSQQVDEMYQRAFKSDTRAIVREFRLLHKAGHYVPVLSRGFISRDDAGRAVRVTGTNMDLTAQHQTREIEAVRPFALELLASGLDIEQILQRLAQKLEALLPMNQCAVWLLNRQTGHWVPHAGPGFAALLVTAGAGLVPGSGGRVSFSAAGAAGSELADSPWRSNFNAMVRERGQRSCWSVALRSDLGQVLGVIDLHRKQETAFDAHQLKLIDLVSQFFVLAIERESAEAQERLAALVFSQSQDGITITDPQGNILLVNPTFSVITGYSAAETLGSNPRILSSGRHDREFYTRMWHSIRTDGRWQGEIWNRRKNGEVYPEWLTISRMSDAHGAVTHYVANFIDIGQKKSDEERIQWMAHFDPLTGLPNRALLCDRFEQAVSVAQRHGESLALMFVDLDNFKHINDSLGRGTGDALLIDVARRVRQLVREQDTVARLGGDEFFLVVPGADADGAAHLAQMLLDAIAKPVHISHHELTVTPSVGIAMYPQDGLDFESLAQHADLAMYRAKQEGGNAYRFFAPEMQLHSARTLLVEGALRRALERNQLCLHYQPQLCLRTGRVVGVEALLRWSHPELGMVSPAEFIPIAEKCGLILPIGEWVLRTAVEQLASWISGGLDQIIMAVNLSAVQFRHPNLPELVSRILEGASVRPQHLELELTEGVASDDPKGAIAIMGDLRGRGVRMSIDDFGTGYSSLSYLKRFPVYKLKIDQSFVRDLTVDPEDKAIVSAIISMAGSLGLQTIAEGVETLEQLDFLRAQGCDEVQGYFCSRPLPALDCEKYLRKQQSGHAVESSSA